MEYPEREMPIQRYLSLVMETGETLRREEARELMETILERDDVPDVAIAALVGAMGARGGTPEEIAGFVEAMRHVAKTLPLTEAERDALVDTCGTGGDASGTFNISTAAALVAAAAGAKVAKHGNRAVTSKCGSADVLEALGIPTGLEGEAAADMLRTHGFVFLLAPNHHPAMKAVMPVRRSLGVRTVFNVLGPLLNPAGARRQVMGVYAPRLVPVVGKAMTLLGTNHALVVHGDGALDELAISGPSEVAEVRNGEVSLWGLTPESLGLKRAEASTLAGGGAAENAEILRAIFAGEQGPRRDVVLLNAAAVLMVAGVVPDLQAGIALARNVIDAGLVVKLVEALGRLGG